MYRSWLKSFQTLKLNQKMLFQNVISVDENQQESVSYSSENRDLQYFGIIIIYVCNNNVK